MEEISFNLTKRDGCSKFQPSIRTAAKWFTHRMLYKKLTAEGLK